ncbi:MAG TPA: hypothetical protein VI168_17840 [Croceibacterium sp.]
MSHRIRLTIAAVAGILAHSAASAAETITYTYDARGRLIKVVVDKPANDVQACYKYDKAGNRQNVKVDVGSQPACPT